LNHCLMEVQPSGGNVRGVAFENVEITDSLVMWLRVMLRCDHSVVASWGPWGFVIARASRAESTPTTLSTSRVASLREGDAMLLIYRQCPSFHDSD